VTVEKCPRPHHLLRRGERCPTCRGDVLTCLACGVNGVGIGFEHKCDPIAAREEREACAKLVDEAASKVRRTSNWWGALLDNLAVRIRERGVK